MFASGLLGLIFLAVWIYCVIDVIIAEESLVRNLPKMIWLILVILVPTVGGIAWLAVGRPEGSRLPLAPPRSSGPPTRTGRGSLSAWPRSGGPEDSADFMQSLEERRRLEAWERDLRRREERLRDSDDEEPGSNGGG